MSKSEPRLLLKKHQHMLNNTRLLNALPDEDKHLRNAIVEIEKFLETPSSPIDCDIVTNQISQMTMSSKDNDIIQEKVHLEKSVEDSTKTTINNNNFSNEYLEAQQAERNSKITVTKIKLISLDEAIRLYNEEKKKTEDYLIEQTKARLLENMSLSKTTFGLPRTIYKTHLTYRKTTIENDIDDDDHIDELDQEKAEIVSDHESDVVDYPDDDDD